MSPLLIPIAREMNVPIRRSYSLTIVASLLAALLTVGQHRSAQADDDQEPPTPPPEQWITGIASTGDAFYASTAQGLLLREASVVRVDLSSPSKTEVAYTHPAGVWDIVSTPDAKSIASVDYKGNLVIFDIASKKPTLYEDAFQRWCQSLLAAPDGRSIVAGNEAGEVMVWDLESAKVTKTKSLDGHAISDLAWSPDGRSLAATDGDGHAHLLKWPSLDSIGEVHLGEEPVWCVAFLNAQTCLVGSGDRNLYRVNVSDFVIAAPTNNDPAGKDKDDKPAKDESTEAESEAPSSAPKVDGVTCFQGKDWITQITIGENGEVAIGEIGGSVHVLRIDENGQVETTDQLESPSGVWALGWRDNQLLIGTRKNGLRAATRAWKWLDE